MDSFGLIFAAVGVLCICGAAFDWNWFINSYKARFFVMLLGRTGARIFYGVLGAVLVVLGTLTGLGLIGEQI